MDLDKLIDRGYSLMSSLKEENHVSDDIFFVLNDVEHRIIGCVVVLHDYSIHLEKAEDERKAICCTAAEMKELLKETHNIKVHIVDREDMRSKFEFFANN